MIYVVNKKNELEHSAYTFQRVKSTETHTFFNEIKETIEYSKIRRKLRYQKHTQFNQKTNISFERQMILSIETIKTCSIHLNGFD